MPPQSSELAQAFTAARQQAANDNTGYVRQYGHHDAILQVAERLKLLDLDGAHQLLHAGVCTAPNDAFRHRIAQEGSVLLCAFADLLTRADAAGYAVDFLREAVKAAPDKADLQNALGRACLSFGTLSRSRDHFVESISAYDTALRINADDHTPGIAAFRSRVIINKAITLWQLAELQEETTATAMLLDAAGLLREAIDTLPKGDTLLTRSHLTRAHEALGNILVTQKQFSEAATHLAIARDAATTGIDRARIFNNIGAMHYKQKEFDLALADYRRALEILTRHHTPVEWSRTQRNRADTLRMKSGYYSNRVPFLEESIEILKEARDVCTTELSPYLRSLINISLGDTLGDLSIIKLDSILNDDAIYFYDDASQKADDLRRQKIDQRRAYIIQSFKEAKLHQAIMTRRADILSSLRSAVREHNVSLDEWIDISAEVTRDLAEHRRQSNATEPSVRALGRPAAVDGPVSNAGQPGPLPASGAMPTHDELEAAGMLFTQARSSAKQAGQEYDIIAHLRSATWWPIVAAGQLTQKKLREIDLEAGKALSTWRNVEGNDLLKALGGHDVPRKTEIVSSRIAAAATLSPGERSARDRWVEYDRSRRPQRARIK